MDFVQWGDPPASYQTDWEKVTYTYDPAGRRIEKNIDGYSTRYCYDGSSVIAEYDGNNNLLRKYIHGPGIDQPICMIEVADSNAVYYYHYDGLGSVVALSDSAGDTVQTYEYGIFGQVAAEDPNHTNPYMFTGRRFDVETGLYYYRARYYNPYIGRFLQTDPVGYSAGMNMYAYCGNNSLNLLDPYGLDVETGQVVTGRYFLLEKQHQTFEQDVLIIKYLLDVPPFNLGVIDIDPTDDGEPSGNDINAQISSYNAARTLLAVALAFVTNGLPIPNLGGIVTNPMWAAYIEVKNWKDLNENYEVDEGDEFSEPYWIEITGFGTGYGASAETFHRNGYIMPVGDEMGYYESEYDAADAAGTAIWCAWEFGIPGVIPHQYDVRAYVNEEHTDDPYHRGDAICPE